MRHIAIISATHYGRNDHGVQVFNLLQSPLELRVNWQFDKIAMLFVADSKFAKRYKRIWCITFNETYELRSKILPTFTSPPLPFCKWALFIGVCNTVQKPHQFMLTSSQHSNEKVMIPYREPIRKHYDVVGCFSPLFLNENWQLLLTSLELRRAHGLSLQVLYIQSIRTQLMDILRVYEKQGIVALEKWSGIDIGTKSNLNYDPNYELVWRNQEAAHTDCFLKYKVSTKYIIVSDIDDILLPRIAPTYIEEFQILLGKQNFAAISYERQDTNVFSSSHPSNFSIYSLLNDAVLTGVSATGKHVAITENVITVTLHWPGLSNMKGTKYVHSNINFMYHFRNWFYDVQPNHTLDSDVHSSTAFNNVLQNEQNRTGRKDQWLFLRSVLKKEKLLEYQLNFEMFMNQTFRKIFDVLYTEQLYYPMVDACYNEIFYKYYRSQKAIYICPGPIRCNIPRIPGLHCITSHIYYSHSSLTHKLQIHFPIRARFVESNNGCNI